jgi:hypothetical protein
MLKSSVLNEQIYYKEQVYRQIETRRSPGQIMVLMIDEQNSYLHKGKVVILHK